MEKVGEGEFRFPGGSLLGEKGSSRKSAGQVVVGILLHPSLTSVVSRGWLQNGEVARASQTDFGFWRFSTKSAELELRVEFSISLWRR